MGVEGGPGEAGERVPRLVLAPRRKDLGRPVGAHGGALEDHWKMGAGGSLGCWGWEEGEDPWQKLCVCGGLLLFPENCLSTWGPLLDRLARARVGIGTNQGSLEPLAETWRVS